MSASESWSKPNIRINGRILGALMKSVKRTKPVTMTPMKLLISASMPGASRTISASARETAPRNPPHHITAR